MNNVVKSVVLLSVLSSSLMQVNKSYAVNVTGTMKTTATLATSCQIKASDIMFGPIDARTASTGISSTSSLNVFCSKGAPYTIGLGGTNANYVIDGDVMGRDYSCPNNCAGIPGYYHYFYLYAGTTDYTQNPKNYLQILTYANGTVVQNMNTLKGIMSGDTISYKITLPGDDNKIWNRGNYNYTGTGTGASQTIPLKAILTTNKYPTPDNYSDTMIATITY